jgi:hypothetical protein
MATETVYNSIASGTAVTFTLTGYYQSVLVQNLTPAGETTPDVATIIWARADGTAAVAQADLNFAISPGQSLVLNNGLTSWDQAQSVIPAGTMAASLVSAPATISPMGSALGGGIANPGCSVSVILDTGSGPVQVAVSSVD